MQKNRNLIWKIEKKCKKWNFEKRFDFDLAELVGKSGFYKNGKSEILKGFWIEEEIGNNAFVFEKGKKLFVPSLKMDSQVKLEDDKQKIVFRDKDENADLIESRGLENFILTQGEKTGLPIYVVDNHNWVFYSWVEFLRLAPLEGGRGVFSQVEQDSSTAYFYANLKNNLGRNDTNNKPFLIHIDAHKDEGKSFLNTSSGEMDLFEVRDETAKLKVSNYISEAIQAGLIQSDFLSLTESINFVDFEEKFELLKKDSQNIILNVDLDIFDPEVSLISLEEKVKVIGYFAGKADLVTFATSPGFIDQEFAVEIVNIFLKYL